MRLKIASDDAHVLKNICGVNNENLKQIEDFYHLDLSLNANILDFESEEYKDEIEKLFNFLVQIALNDIHIKSRDINYYINVVKENEVDLYLDFLKNKKPICFTYSNKPIYAKTLKQNEYIELLKKEDLVYAIGSAGSGKTYLAVCFAASLLKKNNIKKIILTRPAVEAGESLGFLPGDLKEKVDPYLKPLYDALYDMFGLDQTNQMIEKGAIEIAPLAYMRGRTLDDAVIILDEAQNATLDQLKMFLTRLGVNSKMILTGDLSQIDLPKSKNSGLRLSIDITKDLRGVGVINFEKMDVIRHPLVSKIIDRFEKIEKEV